MNSFNQFVSCTPTAYSAGPGAVQQCAGAPAPGPQLKPAGHGHGNANGHASHAYGHAAVGARQCDWLQRPHAGVRMNNHTHLLIGCMLLSLFAVAWQLERTSALLDLRNMVVRIRR